MSREHPGDEDRTDDDNPMDEDGLWFDAAVGADPDAPDPGCLHEWAHLQFDDEDDLLCARCSRVWSVEDDPRDALLTVWQASRLGLSRLERSVDRMAAVLSVIGDVHRCNWCDHWSTDPEDFLRIGERRCCPEHLGQLLDDRSPVREQEIDDAVRYLLGRTPSGHGTIEFSQLWILEKAIVEHPGLTEEIPGAVGGYQVEIRPALRRVLGPETTSTVSDAVRRLAEVLELPCPVSRVGRSVLIGVLARCEEFAVTGAEVDEDSLLGLFEEVAPSNNRDRATVVLDLYRHDLPADGTLSGDMADDLVEALLSRVATELAPLLTGDDGHPRAR